MYADNTLLYVSGLARSPLTDPENNRVTAVLPWKGQIVSGAFSEDCKGRIMEAYLTDDEIKRTNFTKHAEHFRKWEKAKKHAEFNAKVYG